MLPPPQQFASAPRSQQYMQYSSPQDFQRQVSMQGREDTYQQQGMSNFERLIQQLGSYQSSHTAGHGGIDSPYGARRGSDASVGAAMGGTNELRSRRTLSSVRWVR